MPNTFPDWIQQGWKNPKNGMIRVVRALDYLSDKHLYRYDVRVKVQEETTQIHWDFEDLMEADEIRTRIHNALKDRYPNGYELLPWHISTSEWMRII